MAHLRPTAHPWPLGQTLDKDWTWTNFGQFLVLSVLAQFMRPNHSPPKQHCIRELLAFDTAKWKNGPLDKLWTKIGLWQTWDNVWILSVLDPCPCSINFMQSYSNGPWAGSGPQVGFGWAAGEPWVGCGPHLTKFRNHPEFVQAKSLSSVSPMGHG